MMKPMPSEIVKTSLHFCQLTFLAWMASCLASLPAQAQSLGLAPAEFQYRFKTGQPFQIELSVSNEGESPVMVRVLFTDLWYNTANEKIFGPPGSSPRSAANWMEAVPRSFTVPAHGTNKFRVMVTPPLQASGGYYAVVFAESAPQLAEAATADSRAVYTNIRLGSLILLSAEGSEEYAAEVSDLKFTPPRESGKLKLDFLLSNTGNTHIFPQARLAILGAQHELLAKAQGDIKRFLPRQQDHLSVSWAGSLPAGSYTAILTVAYGPDKIYTQEIPFKVEPSPQAAALENGAH